MGERVLDKIFIRDLRMRCILGIYPEERREKQDIDINIMLEVDLREACQSDRMDDTVDYKAVKKEVIAMVEQSRFFLVERLAQLIADICLKPPRVERVSVRVAKPGALRFARTVEIEIHRERETS